MPYGYVVKEGGPYVRAKLRKKYLVAELIAGPKNQ